MSSYEPTVFGGALPPGEEPTPNAEMPATRLTKREIFAAMIMQGYYSNDIHHGTAEFFANNAVAAADALLKELAK